MSTSSNYLLINEFAINPEKIDESIQNWNKLYQQHNDRVLYQRSDNHYLLEIIQLSRPSDFESELTDTLRKSYTDLTKPYMQSDWRMQLIGLKDVVISNGNLLPTTQQLQLRYIEVPLAQYDDYFHWRRPTIFNHIERSQGIEYFTAYHSILSTKPGVLFLSGFSGDTDEYLKVFSQDAFQRISNEAKSKYILGGDQGLETQLYQKVSA